MQGNPGPGGELNKVMIRSEGWNMGGMRACFEGRGYPEDQIYDREVSNSGVVVGGAQAMSKYVDTLIKVGTREPAVNGQAPRVPYICCCGFHVCTLHKTMAMWKSLVMQATK